MSTRRQQRSVLCSGWWKHLWQQIKKGKRQSNNNLENCSTRLDQNQVCQSNCKSYQQRYLSWTESALVQLSCLRLSTAESGNEEQMRCTWIFICFRWHILAPRTLWGSPQAEETAMSNVLSVVGHVVVKCLLKAIALKHGGTFRKPKLYKPTDKLITVDTSRLSMYQVVE